MKPVPIILPAKKGTLHLFCLASLLCKYSLGYLNPTPIPPCGEHITSKRSRRKTIFQIFSMGGVEKFSALNCVSQKEYIIIHHTTFILVHITRDPCTVCMTLNCLLSEVLFVCWDVALNYLLTLVSVSVFYSLAVQSICEINQMCNHQFS